MRSRFAARPIALAAFLLLLGALAGGPAGAVSEQTRPWMGRHAGGALPDDPTPPPEGWFLGANLTTPYSNGLAAGYLWGGEPVSYKLGGSWGWFAPGRPNAFAFRDLRLYGALMYYMVPNVQGGPYVQVGAGLERSSGAVRDLGWPLVPHLGFGHVGHIGASLRWDLNFSAAANGLLSLQAVLLL